MLTAGELREMRRDMAEELPDRALIERPTDVPDGGGGFTQTWAALASNVPCRLAPVGGGEDQAAAGDRITDAATCTITFAAGRDISEADRVTIAGQVFNVLLVRRRGAYEITRRVEAREA